MNKTKIFPYDFLKGEQSGGHFYIRLLPNLTSIGTTGDPIVRGFKSSDPKFLVKNSIYPRRIHTHYYSYAVINNWDDMNRYVKGEVSIIRYGESIYDFIMGIVEGDRRNIFDMQSPYCIKMRVKYKEGYRDFENYYYESNENIIYDPVHPGKNNKEIIENFLLNRDISIEQLAINSSDERYKSELINKYADIIRDEKLKLIGI